MMQILHNKYFKLLFYILLPLAILGVLGYYEILKTKILLKEFIAFGTFSLLIYSLLAIFFQR